MNTVLYCSASGAIYETRAYTKADIDQLVQNQSLQCLTSADRQFDFWFSPTTRKCQRRINHAATEFLLATSKFTAKNVPLLRGSIVIATHDADGDLDGLSWQQLEVLARSPLALSKRSERALQRRINRDMRQQRRRAAQAQALAARTAQAVPSTTSQPALENKVPVRRG